MPGYQNAEIFQRIKEFRDLMKFRIGIYQLLIKNRGKGKLYNISPT